MADLRKPLFVAALVVMGIIVLLEIGALGLLKGVQEQGASLQAMVAQDPELAEAMAELEPGELEALLARDRPPGMAIPYMALLDGLLLFTVGLMGMSLLIRERLHGRIQGIATFIVALLLILGAIAMILLALALVILMISLLLSVPFGTLAYLALYGFFNRGGAAAVLGLLMAFKLAFVVLLILAQQRFLQNRGLILLILTSLLANVIISFLHGLVPRFLVSITDGIAAIIVAILAAIWAIVFLIGAIPAVLRALRPQA